MTYTGVTKDPVSAPHGSTVEAEPPLLPHSCKCGKRWSGNATAHCAGSCHLTFTVVSAFDKHRRNGTCLHPEVVGLCERVREGYTAWGWPDSGKTNWT